MAGALALASAMPSCIASGVRHTMMAVMVPNGTRVAAAPTSARSALGADCATRGERVAVCAIAGTDAARRPTVRRQRRERHTFGIPTRRVEAKWWEAAYGCHRDVAYDRDGTEPSDAKPAKQ